MSKRAICLTTVFFAMGAMVLGVRAHADDSKALQEYNDAMKAFNLRDQGKVEDADFFNLIADAVAQAQDTDLKYQIFILGARGRYWQGEHTQGDDAKKKIFEQGRADADSAKALRDECAEGYYFAGINLARWSEANGIVASLSNKGTVINYMNGASDVTRTVCITQPGAANQGDDGEAVDGYGPDRTLGRLYYKLPGIFGGDHNLSVQYLQKATSKSPTLALNTVYLADTLLHGNDTEKAQGTQLLQNLVKNDVSTFNAGRVPETKDEFAQAQALLAGKPIP